MSDLLIKGMEMPQTCFKCKLSRITPSIYAFCSLNEKCYPADEPPPSDCPLIPIPPHGRLIEKNAVFELIQSVPSVDKLLPVEFMKALYKIPTVIEAEEEQ